MAKTVAIGIQSFQRFIHGSAFEGKKVLIG